MSAIGQPNHCIFFYIIAQAYHLLIFSLLVFPPRFVQKIFTGQHFFTQSITLFLFLYPNPFKILFLVILINCKTPRKFAIQIYPQLRLQLYLKRRGKIFQMLLDLNESELLIGCVLSYLLLESHTYSKLITTLFFLFFLNKIIF